MNRFYLKPTALLLLAGIILLLNACHKSGNMQQNRPGWVSMTDRQDSTKYYIWHINYPDSAVIKPVADSLRHFALTRKQAFMEKLPSDASGYNVTPYELLVQFRKPFHSEQVVSYVANAYQFVGGAHGRSFIKAYNYDFKNGQFITIQTLFEDTTALEAVSMVAQSKIIKNYYRNAAPGGMSSFDQNWVRKGTAPTIANYRQFYLSGNNGCPAKGIKIIFLPYQVGPHYFGIPKVFISDSVFYDELNPVYRPLFRKK